MMIIINDYTYHVEEGILAPEFSEKLY